MNNQIVLKPNHQLSAFLALQSEETVLEVAITSTGGEFFAYAESMAALAGAKCSVNFSFDLLATFKGEYIYKGDKLARLSSPFAGQECSALRRPNGKCIRGKNGNMLVHFNGEAVVVPARQLRKVTTEKLLTSKIK